MHFDVKGDWKLLLLVGGFLLLVFILVGVFLSTIFSLFVWILRGVGTLLGTLVGFAFQSAFNFFIVAGAIYLAYRGYNYLNREKEVEHETVEYTDDDFERGKRENEWW